MERGCENGAQQGGTRFHASDRPTVRKEGCRCEWAVGSRTRPTSIPTPLPAPQLLAYFGIDATCRHPKFIPMPLGAENVNLSLFDRAIASASLVPKEYDLFVEDFGLHGADRIDRTHAMNVSLTTRRHSSAPLSLEPIHPLSVPLTTYPPTSPPVNRPPALLPSPKQFTHPPILPHSLLPPGRLSHSESSRPLAPRG